MGITVGTQLGNFSITGPIPSGAYGDAYQGVEVSGVSSTPPTKVFLKLLREAMCDDSVMRDRFQREIQLLGRLDSPYFPRLLGSGDFEGRPWLALEWINGRPLSYYVKKWGENQVAPGKPGAAPLMYSVFKALAIQALEAIAELENAQIVHRDLHAGNILLGAEPRGGARVVVVDLGLARGPNDATLTGSNEGLGHIYFTAPEQHGIGKAYRTVKSDIYAWGSSLSFALSGDEGVPNTSPERFIEWGVPPEWAHVISATKRELPDDRPDISMLRRAIADIHADEELHRRTHFLPRPTVTTAQDPMDCDWWVTNNGFLIRRMKFPSLIFGNDIYSSGYLSPADSLWISPDGRMKVFCRQPSRRSEAMATPRIELSWFSRADPMATPVNQIESCPRCSSEIEALPRSTISDNSPAAWRCIDETCLLEDDLEILFRSLRPYRWSQYWSDNASQIISQTKSRWATIADVFHALAVGKTRGSLLEILENPFQTVDPVHRLRIIETIASVDHWRRPACVPFKTSRKPQAFEVPSLREYAMLIYARHSKMQGLGADDEGFALNALAESRPRFLPLYEAWPV